MKGKIVLKGEFPKEVKISSMDRLLEMDRLLDRKFYVSKKVYEIFKEYFNSKKGHKK